MLTAIKNKRRAVAVAAVLLGLCIAAVIYFKSDGASRSDTRYTVAPVTRGDIVQAVNTTGTLTPLESVEVSTQVTQGLITEVAVDFNSQVKKGQVLARIDPATYEQRLRQANANLSAAEANYRLAQLNERRMKELHDQDLVTQQEYDVSEAQLQQSQAAMLTNKAEVENARVDLDRCTITSPIDGIVIFKQVEVGKTVVSSLAAPTLFTIARDLSKMRIIAPISEVDVWSVNPGQTVTFTVDALPDRSFQGRITQIRNPYTPSDRQQQQSAMMQQSPIATFDSVIEVDNPDLLLRPSLTANVSVIVNRREKVLRIPNGALRVKLPEAVAAEMAKAKGGSGKAVAATPNVQVVDNRGADRNAAYATVFRLPKADRNATPEAVKVRLGISDSIVTEVLGGLNEGDQVITTAASAADLRQGYMGW
jgi:HlyD family secretion protein